MSKDFDPGRREFLRGMGRKLLLGGLLLGVGSLVAKPGKHNEDCINNGICRGCRSFKDCVLPQALSAKKESGSRDRNR